MCKAHKYADVIKAWADGKTIQYLSEIKGWEDISLSTNPFANPAWNAYEWRVKPVYPTLGEIACLAWYGRAAWPSQVSPKWQVAADAIKAAIASGEHS